MFLNPHRIFFSVRGFEGLFPCTGTWGCVVCLAPQLFLQVYSHANVGPPGPPAATSSGLPATTLPSPPIAGSPGLPAAALLGPQSPTLPCILSTLVVCLCPSYQSGWMFFFNSLVVGLPYSSIFWQFQLFFVFKFVPVLLLVVGGGKVYLPMPPSWLEVPYGHLFKKFYCIFPLPFSLLIHTHLIWALHVFKCFLHLLRWSYYYFLFFC